MDEERFYTPYQGNYLNYGAGPEHLFFGARTSVDPVIQSTSAANPYSQSNPYIDAFVAGRGQGSPDQGGNEAPPQSGDPGRTTNDPLGTLATYGGNLVGFGLGPMSTLAGTGIAMAQGKNPQNMGLMSALGLGLGKDVQINSPRPQQMLNSQLGQTTGSPSMDYFGAINDLATVGQLGAVLDARDTNRGPARDFAGYADFGGGDPAASGGGREASNAAEGAGPQTESPDFNEGGPVMGPTDGQADKVDALLSHGEYVFDAPTVAALGGGNSEAGANKLDMIRKMIRQEAFGHMEQPKPVDFRKLLGVAVAGIRG